jgi:hypothetical protein
MPQQVTSSPTPKVMGCNVDIHQEEMACDRIESGDSADILAFALCSSSPGLLCE